LKGLEVQEDGKILDKDGNQVGQLVEGDAEDLAGYTIGDDGEILDDDGDLVGRCEVTPEKAQELAEQAEGRLKMLLTDSNRSYQVLKFSRASTANADW